MAKTCNYLDGKKKETSRREFLKSLLCLTGLAGVGVYGGKKILDFKNYLTPKDFDNVKWLPKKNKVESKAFYRNGRKVEEIVYNPNSILQEGYTNEDINKNQANKDLYREEVIKKNFGDLEREIILLPDLDGDGKVGKNLNIKEGEK